MFVKDKTVADVLEIGFGLEMQDESLQKTGFQRRIVHEHGYDDGERMGLG